MISSHEIQNTNDNVQIEIAMPRQINLLDMATSNYKLPDSNNLQYFRATSKLKEKDGLQ